MSDQRIVWNEEMIGAGHPTKPDSLGRLLLVECGSDGKGLRRWLTLAASDPETGAGEGALYLKHDGNRPVLYWRGPANAEPRRVA